MSEPYSPWQVGAERFIWEVKKSTRHIMINTKAPKCPWDLCMRNQVPHSASKLCCTRADPKWTGYREDAWHLRICGVWVVRATVVLQPRRLPNGQTPPWKMAGGGAPRGTSLLLVHTNYIGSNDSMIHSAKGIWRWAQVSRFSRWIDSIWSVGWSQIGSGQHPYHA